MSPAVASITSISLLFIACSGLAQANSEGAGPACYTQRENSESDWEDYLAANPDDTKVAACLLDRYVGAIDTKLEPRRMQLIRWVIENHPDMRFAGHLEFDLRVRSDAPTYSEIRELWLAQLDRSPGVVQILLNAASCLAIADSELAAAWLKRARALEPGSPAATRALGQLYARVIIGLAGYNRYLLPTAIDPFIENSPFARRAWSEANEDPGLATETGVALHYWVNYLRYKKITDQDYDPLAEQLLDRAQDLQYPRATYINALGDFYREQAWKRGDPSERLTPKSKLVDLQSEQALEKLDLSRSTYAATGGDVACQIVVGTDGYVWTSAVAGKPLESSEKAILGSANFLVFQPLRINGEPVRFRTKVVVKSIAECSEP